MTITAMWGRIKLLRVLAYCLPMRRLPAPMTVEKIPGGFKVINSTGQSLAYVYGHADFRQCRKPGNRETGSDKFGSSVGLAIRLRPKTNPGAPCHLKSRYGFAWAAHLLSSLKPARRMLVPHIASSDLDGIFALDSW